MRIERPTIVPLDDISIPSSPLLSLVLSVTQGIPTHPARGTLLYYPFGSKAVR